MSIKKCIRLPCGRRVSLHVYVNAWRSLVSLERAGENPIVPVGRWDNFGGTPAMGVLRAMRDSLHERINRHDPQYGHGRKWQNQHQRDLALAARDLNTPRLRIGWLPADLSRRFGYRMASNDD